VGKINTFIDLLMYSFVRPVTFMITFLRALRVIM